MAVNIKPAQDGCLGKISYNATAEECIHDDNCQGIENECNSYQFKWGEGQLLRLDNLPFDPHKYIISALVRNDVGRSLSNATYVFGAQLRSVTDPEDMLQVTMGRSSMRATFKPPCPFAGNLAYELSVKVSKKIRCRTSNRW